MVKDYSDSEKEETHWRHMGYSFQLAARLLLYASSHRQDNTYHSLCYTSCGALAGMRNSSMGPPWRIDPMTHRVMSERSYHRATSHSYPRERPVTRGDVTLWYRVSAHGVIGYWIDSWFLIEIFLVQPVLHSCITKAVICAILSVE